MDYTDIGHECTHQIWLWSYDKELQCKKSRTKGHVYDSAMANGRVDPKTNLGSIAFSPSLRAWHKKRIINSLVDRFPGVKFFVFGDDSSDRVASAQDYYEGL
jgi:hypothetical protein